MVPKVAMVPRIRKRQKQIEITRIPNERPSTKARHSCQEHRLQMTVPIVFIKFFMMHESKYMYHTRPFL